MFSQFPDIGQFLHLPEMDQGLVREYDKSIANEVLNAYIREVIKAVKRSDIETILTDPKLIEFSDEMQKIKFRWLRLNNYIRGLLGIEISENPDLVGEKYLSELFVRIDQQSRIDRIDGLACLSVFGIPIGIIMVKWLAIEEIQAHKHLYEWFVRTERKIEIVSLVSLSLALLPISLILHPKVNLAKQQVENGVTQVVEYYSQQLDQMYEIIQKLNDLKKLIERERKSI